MRRVAERLIAFVLGPKCAECGARTGQKLSHGLAHFLWLTKLIDAGQDPPRSGRITRDGVGRIDIDRIPRIMRNLERVWLACPEMRLGQLLHVLTMDTWQQNDKFYMPDGVIESSLSSRRFKDWHTPPAVFAAVRDVIGPEAR